MDVRKVVFAFFTNARDERQTAHNVVHLSEADQICNEPGDGLILQQPGNSVTISANGTKARGALSTAARWDASERLTTVSGSVLKDFNAEKTLGQLLTETRGRRGISRERVTEEIKIPAHYMRMIESGIYYAVPDELYLVPFIRRYAAFLDLDPQKIVSRFIHDFEKTENDIVVETSASVKDASALRISLLSSAALVATVVLAYFGSRLVAIHTSTAHPPAARMVTLAQHSQGTERLPPISVSESESARAPAVNLQQTAQEPVALAESAAIDTPEINKQAPMKHRRRGHGSRINHRRRHQAPRQ